MRSETLDFIIQVLRRSVIAEICLCGAAAMTLALAQNFGILLILSPELMTSGERDIVVFLFTLTLLSGTLAIAFGISHDLLMKKLKIIIREEENNAKKARKRK